VVVGAGPMNVLDAVANGPSHDVRAIAWLVAVAAVVGGFLLDVPALVFVGAVAFWLSLWWAIRARVSRRSAGPPEDTA
jgi:hypothetical protein